MCSWSRPDRVLGSGEAMSFLRAEALLGVVSPYPQSSFVLTSWGLYGSHGCRRRSECSWISETGFPSDSSLLVSLGRSVPGSSPPSGKQLKLAAGSTAPRVSLTMALEV